MVGFVKRFRDRLALRHEERKAGATERALRKAAADAQRMEHKRAGDTGGFMR